MNDSVVTFCSKEVHRQAGWRDGGKFKKESARPEYEPPQKKPKVYSILKKKKSNTIIKIIQWVSGALSVVR